MKKYTKNAHTGKVYEEAELVVVSAVDENHWRTDQQNLDYKIVLLQAEKKASIDEEIDYFAQKVNGFVPIVVEPEPIVDPII